MTSIGENSSIHKLEQRIDSLDGKVDAKFDELTRLVLRMEGNMMPRAEVYAEDAKRVLNESYSANHQALIERVTKLESGPQRLLGYIGAATGCLSAAIVLLGIVGSILATILTRH